MKLLTKELEKQLPAYGSTDNIKLEDKIAVCKFFNPVGYWTWYAVEYDPEAKIFFGYVKGDENEWGDFSLEELESVKLALGLGIERDLHFPPTKMKEIMQ